MKALFTSLLSVLFLGLMAQNTTQLYVDTTTVGNSSTKWSIDRPHNTPHQECGSVSTPDPSFSPEHFEQFERTFLSRLNVRSAPTRIPVRAHIMRQSNGTGGLTAAELNAAIAKMNSFYINANMEFFLCDGINYVNSDQFYNMAQSDESVLTGAHFTANVVNIYFCNAITATNGGSLCGYAYFPWSRRDVVFMANGCTVNESTLSHELGHFFGLYHTHETSNGAELVARTSCTTTGDLLCGTPAEPVLSTSNVNTSCQYTGSDRDANNVLYVPNPRNLMSYARKDCRTLFTTDQYTRIAYYQQNGRAHLTCSGGGGGTTVNLTKQTDNITASGTSVTFNVTIQNSGTASAGAFTVGFYASTSSSFTNRILLSRESFTSLAASATANRTRTINLCNVPLSSGTYYVGYVIDDQAQVAETNENDNIWWLSNSPQSITCGAVSRANLTKQTDALTGTGQNATFDVTVRNSGNLAAGAFTVGFYASTNSSFTNPVRLGRESFSSLAVGSIANRVVTYNMCMALPTGAYYLGYIIDDQNQITETDETDNTWVWGSSTRSITCGGASTCSGTQTLTTCSGTVTDGSGTSDYSDDLDCTWLIRPSTASSSITLTFTAFETESDLDVVRIYDGANSSGTFLGEFSGSTLPQSVTARSGSLFMRFITDESLTYAGWSANYSCSNVTQANLTSLTSGGTFSASGTTVSLSVPIVNNGTAASGAFRVGFYASTSTTFSNPVFLGQSTAISSLAANGRTDVAKTINLCGVSLNSGTYYVGYIIDDQNQVTEINENDNTWLFSSSPQILNCTTQYTISTAASPSNGGNTSGGGTFVSGQTATVVATPNAGWEFLNWTQSGNQVSGLAAYNFTVTANRSLVANFRQLPPTQYTISTAASPSNGGNTSGGGTFVSGQTATVVATPNAGWEFLNWTQSGNQVSGLAAYNFTVTANRNLVANFRQLPPTQYTISAPASPTNGGTTAGGGAYFSGQTATVVATANTGFEFVNWTENGNEVHRTTTYSFVVTGNRTLAANFRANSVAVIQLAVEPVGSGLVGGSGTYPVGGTVSLWALPTNAAAWRFKNWRANGQSVSLVPNYSFPAQASTLYTAIFEPVTRLQNVDFGDNIKIYPNPATSELTLNIEAVKTEAIDLSFVNALGITYLQQRHGLKLGSNVFVLPIQALTNGLWLLQIKTPNGATYAKFVKN